MNAALLCAIVAATLATACSKGPDNQTSEHTATVPITQSANNEFIGRWCFKQGNMPTGWTVIEISKAGKYVVLDHAGDGSRRKGDLDAKNGALWEQDSASRDHYELAHDGSGDLVVADNDGEIGRAAPMVASASAEDCFKS